MIVTAIATQANDTYGDILSPTLAHLKKMPRNLVDTRRRQLQIP